jgi:hypothetical protein
MKRTQFWCICVFILAVAAEAQVVAGLEEKQGKFFIRGQVVDGATGAPVARARVSVLHREPRTALTTESGGFELSGLGEGEYRLIVRRPGYVDGTRQAPNDGTRVRVGPSREGIVIRINRYAAVEVVVRDEHGEAVPGIPAVLYAESVEQGVRRLRQVRRLETNDLGRARLHNLLPGKYMLGTALGGYFTPFLGNYTSPSFPREGYAAVMPEDGVAEAGNWVEVGYGEEVERVLKLHAEAVYDVHGRLSGIPLRPVPRLRLMRGGVDVGGSIGLNQNSGVFAIRDLPVGEYTVEAIKEGSPAVLGRAKFGVGGETRGVQVRATPTAVLKGVGAGVEESGFIMQVISLDAGGWVQLATLGPNPPGGDRNEIAPGRYAVSVNRQASRPRGVEQRDTPYVASIRVSGQDVLAKGLTVGEGGGEIIVEVETRPGAARLQVKTDETEAAWGVVAYRETADGPVFYEQSCAAGRECVMPQMPPGGYRVLGWRRDAPVAYRDPAVLDRVASRAVSVVLAERQTAEVEVKILGREEQ